MTIYHPKGKIGEIEKMICAECENDTFECFVTATMRGSTKIKGVKCAICGEETEFTPAPPEEFN